MMKRRTTPTQDTQIVAAYKAGMTWRQMAETFGISLPPIRNRLLAAGVVLGERQVHRPKVCPICDKPSKVYPRCCSPECAKEKSRRARKRTVESRQAKWGCPRAIMDLAAAGWPEIRIAEVLKVSRQRVDQVLSDQKSTSPIGGIRHG